MEALTPINKYLTKATATKRIDNNVVRQWTLEVTFEFPGDETRPSGRKSFTAPVPCEYLEKTPDQFTKAELLDLFPNEYEIRQFPSWYATNIKTLSEVRNIEEEDEDFDVLLMN